MGKHKRAWIWVGRGLAFVLLVCISAYLVYVGLDAADKVGSSIGLVIAVAALLAPYLIPTPSNGTAPIPIETQVENSGDATARAGGHANTGIVMQTEDAAVKVHNSGEAIADGPGSVANTGFQRLQRHKP